MHQNSQIYNDDIRLPFYLLSIQWFESSNELIDFLPSVIITLSRRIQICTVITANSDKKNEQVDKMTTGT